MEYYHIIISPEITPRKKRTSEQHSDGTLQEHSSYTHIYQQKPNGRIKPSRPRTTWENNKTENEEDSLKQVRPRTTWINNTKMKMNSRLKLRTECRSSQIWMF